ncbi:hypothetical protein RND71_042754 [Anisodus tanguticus]|uniref:Bifunctional inhibitor/plant lipid transfer protein/seed storage helical domain-containing protein n=1 Tax=Anisodus tanguticus TaxID=243964 RepID=A0AAE1QU94_9SOLA|nr:hypothetical protein RND71_042754 [Anisodus tanguticus]
MAKSLALFLLFNIIFFTVVSSCNTCPKPKPKPKPTPKLCPPPPSQGGKCPIDALKLGVCAIVLNGLLNVTLGTPPVKPCCSLIENLVDLEAAVCLCTALKANILGINLNLPFSLNLLLNVCSKKAPKGFTLRNTCPGPKPKPKPKPKPTPKPPPPPSLGGKCPTDALKLGVCANVLNGLLNVTLGTPPVKPCCSLVENLVDLEAAVCLCTALKANILGINLNLPISLNLLLNVCSKKDPKGFTCPLMIL